MRLLIVKTSSLGDVIHFLPALTDLRRHFPDAQIDWCVEESFAAIPRLHPALARIVPVAIRRWRKRLFAAVTWQEMCAARQALREGAYDAVLDAQGLLKSALLVRCASGRRIGYDANSAREPLASWFYDQRCSVSCQLHAVERNRRLAAAAFGYELAGAIDYGIVAEAASRPWLPARPYVVLLTATSRDDKLWPESSWLALGEALHSRGYATVLPGGSSLERERAARLAAGIPGAVAAPPLSIPELASLLAGGQACVGVDTGLTHLAAALTVPTVALYTATDPGLTGVIGAGFHRNLGGKGMLPEVADVVAELQAGGL